MPDQLALFAEPRGTAVFSDDGAHRYRLTRDHGPGRTLCFVMLNPSKATAEKADPTVRKCLGYARRLGYRKLVVVNLFSLVATDPSEVRAAPYELAVGDPENAQHIRRAAEEAELVVAAWGRNVEYVGRREQRRRDREVAELLADVDLHALSVTKDGHPGHPLYLSYDLTPYPWRIEP